MSDIPHTQQLTDGKQVVGIRRRKLLIEVLSGPDKKLSKRTEADRIVIGAHPSCDLVLTDRTISRQHLEICVVREGYAVRDLDSTNGVFLDHMRVRDVIVDRPTRFRLGESHIRITPLDEAVDVPLVKETRFGPLIGRSALMRKVFERLVKVSPTDLTVLITGESGTGKEVTARAIHEASPRAAKPLIVVDCGALPPTLIESELYGHERGAFTGAIKSRIGAFEAATGGTLFLDEIGELPLDLQPRLLGAIERRRIQPLGSNQSRPIDVRLLAATNRDLRREVNRGAFREDLYFRLAVVTVELPPLREHVEDIPLYIDEILAERSALGMNASLDAEMIQRLSSERWPGNVRELRNVLERAVALGQVELPEKAPAVPVSDGAAAASLAVDPSIPYKTGKALLLEQYERAYVEALMVLHSGNITRAARAAEIDRVYLLRLLDKYGLRPGRT